jgi:hypothetical protein
MLGPDIKCCSWQSRLMVGERVAEAYDRLYYLERACQVQLYAMSTGRALNHVPVTIVEHIQHQFATSPNYQGEPASEHHFAALKRLLDRRELDYSD